VRLGAFALVGASLLARAAAAGADAERAGGGNQAVRVESRVEVLDRTDHVEDVIARLRNQPQPKPAPMPVTSQGIPKIDKDTLPAPPAVGQREHRGPRSRLKDRLHPHGPPRGPHEHR
jgi:hypothetical protein